MIWYSASQPLLFPYVHMVERFARCDHVVVLYEAQFTRDKMSQVVMAGNGPVKITVPLDKAGRRPFEDVVLLDPYAWREALKRKMAVIYGKQSGYRRHRDQFHAFLDGLPSQSLSCAELGHRCIQWCCELLKLGFATHVSHELVPQRPADPCAWMRSFAVPLAATDYLQGAASIESYFVPGVFAPVRVWGQQFEVPHYRQLSSGFNPQVSVLDPLFMHGAEFVRELVRADCGPGGRAGTMARMTNV